MDDPHGTARGRERKKAPGATSGKQAFEGLNDLPMKMPGAIELANKELRLTGVGSSGDDWLAPKGVRDAANCLSTPRFPLTRE